MSKSFLAHSIAARCTTLLCVFAFLLPGLAIAQVTPEPTAASPTVGAADAPGAESTDVTTEPNTPEQPGGGLGEEPAVTVKTDGALVPTAEAKKDWSVRLTGETSVGIGTFVSGEQNNDSVTTAFSVRAAYNLAEKVSLAAGVGLTWYNVIEFGTPLANNEVLLSDVTLTLAHGSIYKHDDSGFNLSGAFRLYLPTSKASQFQNRLFTIRPTLGASLPVGPVTFAYTVGLGKYFNTSTVPSVDCSDFENESDCIQGRENNPEFGFESERRGAEVFLPGSGTNSFYILNALSVNWAIIEGLSLSVGATLYNTFGVRTLQIDEFSNEAATEGRSQTDRLITSIGLSYQIIKQVGIGASLVTDTVRPFGANGDDFVIFDFERAPDNITSVNFSVTGTL